MLDIQPSLLAFEIVTFLLLVAILNQILYKPMLSFIENRNSNLKADANLADAQDHEREALINEAGEILAKAKAEASQTRHEAISAAKAEAETKINAAKGASKTEIESFSSDLAGQKAELKSAILSNSESYKQSLAKALKI
ncbi:MAG: F0F1 ATP synthase subunit B' [Campylobacterales bacterium]|nr:F0F1 ATP synthase subunit B' [Campylobacterales bacterium]